MGTGKIALIVIGVLVVLVMIAAAMGGSEEDNSASSTSSSSSSDSPAPEVTSPENEQVAEEMDPAPAEEPNPAPAEEEKPEEDSNDSGNVTREQRNALRSAKNYLDFMSFSDEGLRKQLDFEGFPPDAIDYAMQNIEVDWNEQAVKKAREYDETGLAMSDSGLYDQLIFEGFTPEQAQYGVDNM